MADWGPWFAVLCLLHSAGRIDCFPAATGDGSCSITNTETFIYQEQQYIIFYDTVTWDEAAAICPTYQASLATVDNMQKALAVTEYLSDTNRRISEVWLGARKINTAWMWVATNSLLPSQPGSDDFPPWVYMPEREGKECLAIVRKGHSGPAFMDNGCTQLKPFICERNKGAVTYGPRETRTIRSGNSLFTLYQGSLDWYNAVAHCRKLGKRLAVVNSATKILDLSQAMTKSRPAFENAWIGGKFSYGTWMWAPTGQAIPDIMDPKTNYPPWVVKNSTRKANGCILMDRYLCEEALFYDTNCLRTRDFICEQTTTGQQNDPNQATAFRFENKTYELVLNNLTWAEASAICKVKSGYLAHIPHNSVLEFIIDLMAENVEPLNHIWVGGELVNGTWTWVESDEKISMASGTGDVTGAHWCDSMIHYDMPCLNLDRTDHSQPSFYGLECNNTQPSVCRVDCRDPLNVPNGRWSCTPALTNDIRTCSLECADGHRVFGSDFFTCAENGWVDDLRRNIAPECLLPEELGHLLLDKLVAQIQTDNISSILFVVEDSQNVTEENLSAILTLINAIVQAIPLSEYLRAGVTLFGSNVMQLLPMNNINSCTIARDTSPVLEKRILGKANFESAFVAIQKQTNLHSLGKHTIIVIFASSDPDPDITNGIYEELKANGHVFYVIASNETRSLSRSSNLLKLATIGPDESFNTLILEDSTELMKLMATIAKRKSLQLDCDNVWGMMRGNGNQGDNVWGAIRANGNQGDNALGAIRANGNQGDNALGAIRANGNQGDNVLGAIRANGNQGENVSGVIRGNSNQVPALRISPNENDDDASPASENSGSNLEPTELPISTTTEEPTDTITEDTGVETN